MKRKFLQILSVLLIMSLLLMGCSQRNIQDSEPSTSDNTQEENTQTEQTEQTNETTANAASKDSLRVCDTPLFSFELPEDAYYKGFREEDDFNGTGYHSVSEDFYNEYAEYMKNYYKVEDFEDDNATKNDQILRDKEHLWFDIYTTNNDSYSWGVKLSSEFEGMSDEEMLRFLLADPLTPLNVKQGYFPGGCGVTTGERYTVYAFGYSMHVLGCASLV